MTFAQRLLDWYTNNARNLPWRFNPSAYKTWVSEIMLQQTQVETVIPYFKRWMEEFPDIHALAFADEQVVLSAWEGLGYYRRAHNLHRAAQQVVQELGGELPRTRNALKRLPGVGDYTAGAIASIAFGEDVPAVDGNVRRVLARYFDVSLPARSTQGERLFWKLAQEHLPAGKAGDYNQALMELGALICTPKNPHCKLCPINQTCQAFLLGLQDQRPVVLPKKKVPHLTVTAAVIQRDERVLLSQRPPGGLLAGLWEFPGGTLEKGDAGLPACLQREIREELGVEINVGQPFGRYQHAYTHFKITLHAFLCRLAPGVEPRGMEGQALVWAKAATLPDYPMGKVDRLIARRLIGEDEHETLSG
ncbi:MAG: A/G-specific adenine glycosylase [Chloroflexi bacterium]|jgi:A/G-specific adenine glycosylase|nr:A/G-specific adenine glycosylase [Chloroflexota bacterium]